MNSEYASELGRAIDHITSDISRNAEILDSHNINPDIRKGITSWIESQIEARKAIAENLNKYTSSIT